MEKAIVTKNYNYFKIAITWGLLYKKIFIFFVNKLVNKNRGKRKIRKNFRRLGMLNFVNLFLIFFFHII